MSEFSQALIKSILSRPIAFHRCFVDLTGSVTSALMLSQALYWSGRTEDPDGWFWKSCQGWTEETGMARCEQDTARRELRKLPFWSERHERIEHKIYYKINLKILWEFLTTNVGGNVRNLHSGKQETYIDESKKLASDHSETTSEITTETTESAESSSLEGENLDLERDVFEWCKATWGKNQRTRGVKFKAKYPEQWRRVEEAVGQEEFRKDWIENLERKEPLGPVDWIKTMQADNQRPALRRSPAKRPKQTLQQELDALPDNVGWDPE